VLFVGRLGRPYWFEVMIGDMTTFTPPEDTARNAGTFWA
jgi:hypothetical protein